MHKGKKNKKEREEEGSSNSSTREGRRNSVEQWKLGERLNLYNSPAGSDDFHKQIPQKPTEISKFYKEISSMLTRIGKNAAHGEQPPAANHLFHS